MRLLLPTVVVLLAGCADEFEPRAPPLERFVYPTGLVHLDDGTPGGVLYVASSNFDKRYDTGGVTAVALDRVGQSGDKLPALGAPPQELVQVLDLGIEPQSQVLIQSFAGEMVSWQPPLGSTRLYVPSRAEGSFLQTIELKTPTELGCWGTDSRDCIEGALSLIKVDGVTEGRFQAQAPLGLAVAGERLMVTNQEPLDFPDGSDANFENFLVSVPALEPRVTANDFISLGDQASQDVAVGQRYAYVTGRFYRSAASAPLLITLVDLQANGRLLNPGLNATYPASEARGVALSANESRLYVTTRAPDSLLVLKVEGATSSEPRLTLINAIPLPDGAGQLTLLSRQNRADLVAVICTSGGVVALYDEGVGQLVAQVDNVGADPFALAVDRQELSPGVESARLFVSNFGDGRISVLDVPDLARPETLRLVGYLGLAQLDGCLQATNIERPCEQVPQ